MKKKVIQRDANKAAENFTVNAKGFFKQAISPIKLKKAWWQLKNNHVFFKPDFSWFEKNSQMLINRKFQYPTIKKVNLIKLKSNSCREILSIIHFRVKIVEKALLNSLEIIFEGAYA